MQADEIRFVHADLSIAAVHSSRRTIRSARWLAWLQCRPPSPGSVRSRAISRAVCRRWRETYRVGAGSDVTVPNRRGLRRGYRQTFGRAANRSAIKLS
jgi:hypothetical protein